MSFEPKALGDLFEFTSDAVLGIENDTIIFANPAAAELLNAREGDRAADILPKDVLEDPSARFCAACSVRGVSLDLAVTRQGGFTFVRAARRGSPVLSVPASDRVLDEFGGSLSTAQMAIDAILSEDITEERRQDRAAMLYRSFYRLRRLHRHLMLAACVARDDLPCRSKPVDMRLLCRDLCDSVDKTVRKLGYDISFDEPDDACCAVADAELIETMLLNILTNSLLHARPGSEIRVSLRANGDRVVLAVDDAGDGMSAEKLSSALSGAAPAALSDTAAGAGLGLFIARGIAEKHGGTFIMESRENKGTSIRVSLPGMPSDGVELFSHPGELRHFDGMRPILTELSVFLSRGFYNNNMMD